MSNALALECTRCLSFKKNQEAGQARLAGLSGLAALKFNVLALNKLGSGPRSGALRSQIENAHFSVPGVAAAHSDPPATPVGSRWVGAPRGRWEVFARYYRALSTGSFVDEQAPPSPINL